LPFAPTWCLNNSQLVFGLYPQSVRSHVQSDTTKGLLTDRDDIQHLFDGNSNPCLLVYRDTRRIMEEAYPTRQMWIQMALRFMLPEIVSMDISMLPFARAITRNMQPAIWLARRKSNGFEFESFQNLPGGSLSASAPIAIAAVVWTKPDDLIPTLANRIHGLLGVHKDYFNVAITDGSVEAFPVETSPEDLRGLFTRDQAEIVERFSSLR